MTDDAARMKRIELEEHKPNKREMTKRSKRIVKQIDNLATGDASKWIAQTLYSVLSIPEVMKVRALLELTDRRAIINAIENYNNEG